MGERDTRRKHVQRDTLSLSTVDHTYDNERRSPVAHSDDAREHGNPAAQTVGSHQGSRYDRDDRYAPPRPERGHPVEGGRLGGPSRNSPEARTGRNASPVLFPSSMSSTHRYTKEDRQFAFADRHLDSHRSTTATSSTSRNPSVPPPQPSSSSRPISHTTHSRSQPPPSPPSSRGTLPHLLSSTLPPMDTRHYRPSSSSWDRKTERLPSPPASRGDAYPAAPRSSHRQPIPEYDMKRTASQSSYRSAYSASRPTGRVSTSPSYGSDGEDEDLALAHETGGNEGAGTGPRLRRPKRTRVLMTHIQQHRLGVLWKRSKFPSTAEREDIAAEVGLTPRQVQVWFQNRRQTFRKQIATNTIPPGSDPADYADLQKSPRSRRLSLEAASAANTADERDRVSQWAEASSSSTTSSFPSRPHTTHRAVSGFSIPPPDIVLPRPPRSAGSGPFAHGPPSPPRRILHPEPPPPIWAQETPPFRPTTASSGSSNNPPSSAHTGPTFRPWSRPGLSLERSASHWSDPHSRVMIHSPSPYSPPPTADPISRSHSSAYPEYADQQRKRFKGYSQDSDGPVLDRDQVPPKKGNTQRHIAEGDMEAKTSHLPPNLAALAIKRPVELDHTGTERTGTILPSLSTLVDGFGQVPPRPRSTDFLRRNEEDVIDLASPRETSTRRGDTQSPLLRSGDQGKSPYRSEGRGEMDGRSTSSSSLPRFNDLFR